MLGCGAPLFAALNSQPTMPDEARSSKFVKMTLTNVAQETCQPSPSLSQYSCKDKRVLHSQRNDARFWGYSVLRETHASEVLPSSADTLQQVIGCKLQIIRVCESHRGLEGRQGRAGLPAPRARPHTLPSIEACNLKASSDLRA